MLPAPGSDHRCRVHTAAANASPPRRQVPPTRRFRLVEPRRTPALGRYRRDAPAAPRRRRAEGRYAVAAPTPGGGLRRRPRVKSIAPTDTPPGFTSQRPHRFTGPLSFDGSALPFIHFEPSSP